jgi:ligand-binding sensor domain-containing protein
MQTADGYLWIDRENGVLRFDGLTFNGIMASKEDSPR